MPSNLSSNFSCYFGLPNDAGDLGEWMLHEERNVPATLSPDDIALLGHPLVVEEAALGRAILHAEPGLSSLYNTLYFRDAHKALTHITIAVMAWRLESLNTSLLAVLILNHFVLCSFDGPREVSDGLARLAYRRVVMQVGKACERLLHTRLYSWFMTCFVALLVDVAAQRLVTGWSVIGCCLSAHGMAAALGAFMGYNALRMVSSRSPPPPKRASIVADANAKRATFRRMSTKRRQSMMLAEGSHPSVRNSVSTEPAKTSLEGESSDGSDGPDLMQGDGVEYPFGASMPKMPPAMHNALSLMRSKGWSKAREVSGCVTCTKQVPWCRMKATFSTAVIRGATVQEIVDFFADDDGKKPTKELNIFKYEHLLKEYNRIAHTDKYREMHMLYKTPIFAVSPRDVNTFTVGRHLTVEEKEQYGFENPQAEVFMIGSTDSRSPVPTAKGHVRVRLYFHGICMEEVPEGCKLYVCISVDPMGNLPPLFVDIASREQANKLVYVKKTCEKVDGKKKQ